MPIQVSESLMAVMASGLIDPAAYSHRKVIIVLFYFFCQNHASSQLFCYYVAVSQLQLTRRIKSAAEAAALMTNDKIGKNESCSIESQLFTSTELLVKTKN